MTEKEKEAAYHNEGTWMSLLDLLNWYEFFVSVDQTKLWRRHLAWAKPKGKDIRDYTTQRFSSNMVFLSLLLGADLSVLFNSAVMTTEIRNSMSNQTYDLKYFIGITMICACCCSILGLVTTFTAWGMIGAISDCNSHCLLRSSMGEYVTALPSRFVVASLYLFLAWFSLMIIEMLAGPFLFIVLGGVFYTFFQVVVSLSTFGRLIIHTGAMGKKRVLDPELEKLLLPSGLHASLLIKATERSRRQTSVVSQYKSAEKGRISPSAQSRDSGTLPGNPSINRYESYGSVSQHGSFSQHEHATESSAHAEDMEAIFSTARSFDITDASARSAQTWPKPQTSPGHRRGHSTDSIEEVDELVKHINFPRASILNKAVVHNELKDILENTLSSSTRPSLSRENMARRQSEMIFQRGSSMRNVMLEWEAEEDARELYGFDAPLELVVPQENVAKNHKSSQEEDGNKRSWGLRSLKSPGKDDHVPPTAPFLPDKSASSLDAVGLEAVEEGSIRSSVASSNRLSALTMDSPFAPGVHKQAYNNEDEPLISSSAKQAYDTLLGEAGREMIPLKESGASSGELSARTGETDDSERFGYGVTVTDRERNNRRPSR